LQCREQREEAGVGIRHPSMTALQVTETHFPLRPSRLCGLSSVRPIAKLRLSMASRPEGWTQNRRPCAGRYEFQGFDCSRIPFAQLSGPNLAPLPANIRGFSHTTPPASPRSFRHPLASASHLSPFFILHSSFCLHPGVALGGFAWPFEVRGSRFEVRCSPLPAGKGLVGPRVFEVQSGAFACQCRSHFASQTTWPSITVNHTRALSISAGLIW
jgi:hypothetical protein